MLKFHEEKLRKIGEAHGLSFTEEDLNSITPDETDEAATKLKNNILIVKKSDINMQRVLMKDIQNNIVIINDLKSKIDMEGDKLQELENRVMEQVLGGAAEIES